MNMDYLEFYRLKEVPFANAPDLRFYYDGYQYGHSEERIIHVI
ncbi:AAA family ATPase, partial [Candidatus Desantisbacteria bacterium CG07_land_8_20_14_0_80_39_15]